MHPLRSRGARAQGAVLNRHRLQIWNLVDAAACRIPRMTGGVEIGSRVSGRTVQTDTGFAADNTAGGLVGVVVFAAVICRCERTETYRRILKA